MAIKLDTTKLYVGQEVKVIPESGMHYVVPHSVAIIGYISYDQRWVTLVAKVTDDGKIAPQIVDMYNLRGVGTSQASNEVREYYNLHRNELWSNYL